MIKSQKVLLTLWLGSCLLFAWGNAAGPHGFNLSEFLGGVLAFAAFWGMFWVWTVPTKQKEEI
jgi:hypothetical protein